MGEPEKAEIELTQDLLEYAKAVALIEAQKHCPKYVNFDDVIQEVYLKLLSKPPKYDPSKGASVKTLLYTVVQRIVIKYAAREARQGKRFKQLVEPKPSADEAPEGKLSEPRAGTMAARARMIGVLDAEDVDDATRPMGSVERRHVDYTTKILTTDDVLEFIDDEESRHLCQTVIDCNGNMSKAARRIGVSEGTVRYRLKMLAPKLVAAGFDPFNTQEQE